MKGIYFAQDLSHAGGIEKKIYRQIEEMEKAGFSVTPKINPKRTVFHLFKNIVPFFSEQYFETKTIDWQSYDFAYIRKGAIFDKSVVKLLKKAKIANPKIRIIVEIPTYPYLNEFQGLLKWDIALKEKKWTPQLKKYVDQIVTYSDDKEIFGIPCLNLSNAYDFKPLPPFLPSDDESVHLLAVAALCFYHGYDRVIKGLADYYEKHPDSQNVTFTVVGDGPVLKEYRQLVADYHLEKVVHLVGRKDFSELDSYYQQADIGIDSLARHRSDVSYNSSLKGKEYLAKGLPIVSGVKTDLDHLNLPFYYRVPGDDTNLKIEDLLIWYHQLLQHRTEDELAKEIYDYGKKHFSFEKTFRPVIKLLGDKYEQRLD